MIPGSNNAALPALPGPLPDGALPAALRDRWRDESVRSVWLRPSDWYHPAVDALAAALLADGDRDAAAAELGRARGYDGVGIGETMDDLTCLYRTLGADEPPMAVLRSLCEGWADAQSGTMTEGTSDSGGGSNLGALANGDWVQYKGVEFGSSAATQFKARVASGAAAGVSGLVEVRLDSRTSTPVGSFAVGNTGGWQSWRTIPANIASVTGTHDVYLTFTSGQSADFVNVNWFGFGH